VCSTPLLTGILSKYFREVKKIIAKMIDTKKTECIFFNSDVLSDVSFSDVLSDVLLVCQTFFITISCT
jgi:hypothetical protein